MNLAAVVCVAALAADPLPADAPKRLIDFDTEIIPVLTKAGCNAGACHGAAAGRGGFHLSLLGADPAADYDAIVHAFEGRRVNTVRPAASLVVAKPTGNLDHGGDLVLDEDGPGAQRLLEWIRSGAPRGGDRKLTQLTITPLRHVSESAPAEVPLQVLATFDDQPPEDVTQWTVFTPSDPAGVQVDRGRRVARILRRGQQVLIARFLNRVVALQWMVPLNDEPVDLSGALRTNFIDEEILATLAKLRLPVSPTADDATYLRRVSLDLTGTLPTPEVVDSFVRDQSDGKRAKLVDSLLGSDAFTDYWTLRFARLLRVHSLPNEKEGMRVYTDWLRAQVARQAPLDQMARELLTSTGDAHVVGPANFGRMVGDARAHAELVSQFFMAMQMGCANCHNHPLDRWTQDDYHGLAAVFARLDRGREVRLLARGAVTNLRTNEPAIPRIPGDRYLPEDGDPRQAIADWLISGDNRYFARATVNRLWRAMFGRGLVEPTDDLRQTNPATHPELLDRLAEDFVQNGHSLRHTLRKITLSSSYARSDRTVQGNAADDRYYSHAFRRPLEPEVLVDAIADVTGVADAYDGRPPGTRAVAIVDPLSPAVSLDILGRCTRLGACDESGPSGGGLPAQLHLLNGEIVNRKLSDEKGRLQQRLREGIPDDQIVDEFYVRALSRHASGEELNRWRSRLQIDKQEERQRRLEDFVWSLLNNRQFLENH
jgi:Protein of unknown function (DUF1549)/Protein of unknown function (DUF1553)